MSRDTTNPIRFGHFFDKFLAIVSCAHVYLKINALQSFSTPSFAI